MEIKFLCENHGYYGFARKRFEITSLPYEGLKIEDNCWKGFKKIIELSVNYEDNTALALLEDEIFFDKSMIGQLKDNYKENGWEIK